MKKQLISALGLVSVVVASGVAQADLNYRQTVPGAVCQPYDGTPPYLLNGMLGGSFGVNVVCPLDRRKLTSVTGFTKISVHVKIDAGAGANTTFCTAYSMSNTGTQLDSASAGRTGTSGALTIGSNLNVSTATSSAALYCNLTSGHTITSIETEEN